MIWNPRIDEKIKIRKKSKTIPTDTWSQIPNQSRVHIFRLNERLYTHINSINPGRKTRKQVNFSKLRSKRKKTEGNINMYIYTYSIHRISPYFLLFFLHLWLYRKTKERTLYELIMSTMFRINNDRKQIPTKHFGPMIFHVLFPKLLNTWQWSKWE